MKFSITKKNKKYIIIAVVVLLGLIGIATGDDDVDTTDTSKMLAADIALDVAIETDQVATDTATPTPTDEPTLTSSPSPTIEPTPKPETKIIYLMDNATVEVSYDAKYCGSKNSKVFHYITCTHVGDIAKHNFVVYDTREDAITAGKRPCKNCEP